VREVELPLEEVGVLDRAAHPAVPGEALEPRLVRVRVGVRVGVGVRVRVRVRVRAALSSAAAFSPSLCSAAPGLAAAGPTMASLPVRSLRRVRASAT